MAEYIKGHLYRVSIGSERNFLFIHAADEEDLIRFLAKNHPSKADLFGVKEITSDGSLRTVSILDNPLFSELYSRNEQLGKGRVLPAGVTMIDDKPWAVMLPTGGTSPDAPSLWRDALSVVDNDPERFHHHGIVSWCQEISSTETPNWKRLRGYDTDERSVLNGSFNGSSRLEPFGYRPVLVPLDPETLEVNTSPLLGHADGTVFCFGTLYMGGEPQPNPQVPTCAISTGDVPRYIPHADLCVGNTAHDPAHRISWIKVGDALIADRNLLKQISWRDLDQQGLALGPDHLRAGRMSLESVLSDARHRAASIAAEHFAPEQQRTKQAVKE